MRQRVHDRLARRASATGSRGTAVPATRIHRCTVGAFVAGTLLPRATNSWPTSRARGIPPRYRPMIQYAIDARSDLAQFRLEHAPNRPGCVEAVHPYQDK